MPRTEPFDEHTSEYDTWFPENALAYESELLAVRALLPEYRRAVEIGVGSGRFAGPLGISLGVEPSRAMAALARSRGIHVLQAAAEHLPFADATFDLVLMVTTICFLDDVSRSFSEAHRALTAGGHLLVGFLDRDTELGRVYQEHKADSVFYRMARFASSEEVTTEFEQAGFGDLASVQTIYSSPGSMERLSVPSPGDGSGLFVVMRGRKG
jgi:SAM-dependent methyltransferase